MSSSPTLFPHHLKISRAAWRILLCLSGAQGSGKGKQAKLFEATLRSRGLEPRIIEMSDLLEKTGDAKIRHLKKNGHPVPCGLLVGLFEEAATAALAEGANALVVDGYPRYTFRQVDDFVSVTRRLDLKTSVVQIRATLDLCVKRIADRAKEMAAAGLDPRQDDLDPQAVRRRLGRSFATGPAVTRRLIHYHGLSHFTATARDNLSAAEIHDRLVAQMRWLDQGSARSDDWMLVGAGGRPIAVA